MAVIFAKPGSASARPQSTAGSVTVFGRAAAPVTRAEAPAPLDAREQLELDALIARTRRTWADRLAAEEEALAPEEATGFAVRVGAAFDAESERTLVDIDPRLRPQAQFGLSAIGEDIVGAAADYEELATRIGLFNTAKRTTDDIAALIVHDRSAHDRLREEGLSRLGRAPLSDGARVLLEQRLVTQLAHGHAAAHIDDDPADALTALRVPTGDGTSPYDTLTDEQRARYAALAEAEDERGRAELHFTERSRLEALIEAGRIGREEIEISSLDDEAKRDLVEILDRRNAVLTETAAEDPFNEFGPDWNPSDPLGLDASVAGAMDRSLAQGSSVVSGARTLVRQLGQPVLEAEIAVFDWAANKAREYRDPIAAFASFSDIVSGIPWFFASVLGGISQVLSLDFGEGERLQSAKGFADHLLREFERGVEDTDAARISIKKAGERIEARAFELLDRNIRDGTIDPDEAAIYVPLVGAMALSGLVRKRLHAGSGDPQRDVADFADGLERVADAARFAQIRALIPDYLREMRKVSNLRLQRKQMKALKNALIERDFSLPLDPTVYTAHKKIWSKNRADLRDRWTEETGVEWPTRIRKVINRKTGEVEDQVVRVDGHHIIPQKNGGPQEWWNILPVGEGHQSIIHGFGFALTKMQGIAAGR